MASSPRPSGDDVLGYISPRDRDLMIRTVIGEADGQPDVGQAAVAHVIMNRVIAGRYGGDNPTAVVLAPSQFEPWGRRRRELLAIDPNGDKYQRAAGIVDDVLAGNTADPTSGATHFWSPNGQAAMGRSAPSWAGIGRQIQIGGHVFSAPEGFVTTYTSAKRTPKADAAGQGASAASPAPTPMLAAAKTAPAPVGDMSDDDIVGLLSPKRAQAPAGAALMAPAGGATPAGSAPLEIRVQPKAAAPVELSDDDVLGLLGDRGTRAAKAPIAATPAEAKAAGPLVMPPGMPAPASAPAAPDPSLVLPPGMPPPGYSSDAAQAEAAAKAPPGDPNLWSGFRSFANGALLGAGVPLQAATAALVEKARNGGDLGDLYQQAKTVYGGARDAYAAQNPVTHAAAEIAGSIPPTVATTMAGGAALGAGGNALLDAVNGTKVGSALVPYLQAAGRFVTGHAGRAAPATATSVATDGNLLMRAASGLVAGAGAGAVGGAVNTGLTGGDVASNALHGAQFGAAVGAGLPVLGSIAGGAVNKLTGAAAPEMARLAQTARDAFGIPVRAAEVSDGSLVGGLDSLLSKIPGMGYGAIPAAKQAALNKAVVGQIGETGDRLTPGVMDAARTRLGATFDRVAAQSGVRADQALSNDLAQIFADAGTVLTAAELKPLQKFVGQGLLPMFGQAGTITGEAYQALTRKGAPLDRLMNGGTNSNVQFFAGQIREALDGALERSAPAALVDELRQARTQWRALKILEPLASDGGQVSPEAFRRAVAKATPQMAYGGGGSLADLARVAQAFGPEAAEAAAPVTSGPFAGVRNVAQIAGGLAGGAAGVNQFGGAFAPYLGNAALAAAGTTMAAAAAGRAASSVLRSNSLRDRIVNQALGIDDPGTLALIARGAADAAPEMAEPVANRLRAFMAENDNAKRAARAGGIGRR